LTVFPTCCSNWMDFTAAGSAPARRANANRTMP
jgi:hypothetical protein